MASENSSVNEHIGRAAMQSMEKLKQAGFSEDQSKAQTEAMIKMYDATIDHIDQIANGLKAEFSDLKAEFNDLKTEFRALEGRLENRMERRCQRSDMVMVVGFIGVIITIVVSV